MHRLLLVLFLSLAGLVAAGCGNSSDRCGPANCQGCCDEGGQCLAGSLVNACGTTGNACITCAATDLCQLGVCVPLTVGTSDGGTQPIDAGTGDGGLDGGSDAGADGGSDGGTCGPGLQLCDGVCVNTQSHNAHCGVCNNACVQNQLCQDGQCITDCRITAQCPPGLFYCDAADGQCKAGCGSSTQCPQPGGCNLTTHQCECAPGSHLCGASCVSDTSVLSCGTSCTPCPVPANGSATCNGQSCGIACDPGFHACGGQCVPNGSVLTCGTSCSPCPGDPNGTATCNGTACGVTCNAGHLTCGGACRTCPTVGVTATACSGATCVASSCASGFRLCNGTCAACPTDGVTATTCSGSTCVAQSCATTHRQCGTACSLCPTDNVVTTTCSGSACVPATCSPGFKICGNACCPKWTVTPVTTVGGFGDVSIAFTPAGVPLIAYDRTPNGIGLARLGAGGWTFETVVTAGRRGALRVGANGHPRVAYQNGSGVSLAEWNGSSWSTQTVELQSGNGLYDPALALDAQGQPHVAYFDQNNLDLRYAWRSGSTWFHETAAAAGDVGRFPEISIDSSGAVHASSQSFSANDTPFARKAAGTWTVGSLPSSGWSYGNDNAADALGNVHFVYGGQSYTLRYTRWNGSAFVDTSFVNSQGWTTGGSWGTYAPSIDVDGSGTPHVAYYFQNNVNQLRYSKRTGATWTTETVDPVPGRGGRNDLAVNAAGFVGIAYTGTENNVTTLYFATDQ